MTPTPFRVFVHLRRQRPQHVGEVTTDAVPSVWQHNGQNLYFVTADLTEKTLTYSDVKPVPLGTAQQFAEDVAANVIRRQSRRST